MKSSLTDTLKAEIRKLNIKEKLTDSRQEKDAIEYRKAAIKNTLSLLDFNLLQRRGNGSFDDVKNVGNTILERKRKNYENDS